MQSESQNIEYKESWRDEYLKWICGFANAQGGTIYIGVNDNKDIIGVADSKRLMEDIPNKITNYLGIVADVNLLRSEIDKAYIEIVVEPSNVPIAYHGQYHYRTGSTKQELKGVALQQFILKKMGRSWDDIPHETATIDAIDRQAIDYFLRHAIDAKRIDAGLLSEDTFTILDNLCLLTEDGHLKNAALLMFAKNPLRYFTGVEFKIGRFGVDESDLIFQDVVEGNILQMAERVISLLRSKYLISPIHYEGMQRRELLEIPEDALREMLYNSIIHKQYTGTAIQMWIFHDHIELWNEGILPEGYTIETLMQKHSSRPRNKNIASVFYKAGFVETWGRGIKKICEGFDTVGMQPPHFEITQGGMLISFKRRVDVVGSAAKYPSSTHQVPTKYPPSTPQVGYLVNTIGQNQYSVKEMMEALNLKDRVNFRTTYLNPAIEQGCVQMLYPDQPNHPKQKYYLTERGRALIV